MSRIQKHKNKVNIVCTCFYVCFSQYHKLETSAPPKKPKKSQDCETALASQLWSENIHLVSRGVMQSVMGSAMEPAMESV